MFSLLNQPCLQSINRKIRKHLGKRLFPTGFTYKNANLTSFRREIPGYTIDYFPGGDEVFMTFLPDNVDDREALPWGAKFLLESGYSVLGLKYKNKDWYRGKALHQFIRSWTFRTFVARFHKIYFYGASKGGYAALVFSKVFKAPTVIAFCPQTTMDPGIVPWEKRFAIAREADWSGDFRDAADSLREDGKYYVICDPFVRSDRLHLDRLPQHLITRFSVPFGGHTVPAALQNMGMLKEFVNGCIRGDITPSNFSVSLWFKSRRHYNHYLSLFHKNKVRKRPELRQRCLTCACLLGPRAKHVLFDVAVELLKRRRLPEFAAPLFRLVRQNETESAINPETIGSIATRPNRIGLDRRNTTLYIRLKTVEYLKRIYAKHPELEVPAKADWVASPDEAIALAEAALAKGLNHVALLFLENARASYPGDLINIEVRRRHNKLKLECGQRWLPRRLVAREGVSWLITKPQRRRTS